MAEVLMCRVIRGDTLAPNFERIRDLDAFEHDVQLHGMAALLHAQPHTKWPDKLRESFRDQAIRDAIWELRHQQLLAQVLEAFAEEGVQPLLFKGTALAYSIYSDPVLRSRGDTDMLVAYEDRVRADSVLRAQGFERHVAIDGEFVAYQASYEADNGALGVHVIDLHWKINNAEVLAAIFSHAELLGRSQPLPRLSPHARAASLPDALLLACMHRGTHRCNPYYVDGQAHFEPDRLIWLFDLHLIAARLNTQEWREVVESATVKGLCGVCLEGLERTSECFGTHVPREVLAALAGAGPDELPARFLAATEWRQMWMNFVALGSARRRWKWLRETLVPSTAYMRARYASSAWLPWLHLKRATWGACNRLKRMIDRAADAR